MKTFLWSLILISQVSFAQLDPMGLKTTDGSELQKKDLNNETALVSLFFSSCRHTCLLINSRLKKIHDNLNKDSKIKIISVTVDPTFDTEKVLAKYSKKWRESSEKWLFVTGEEKTIFKFIEKELKIEEKPTTFVHSEKVLIYKDGKLDKSFSLLDDDDFKKLQAYIK